MDARSAVLSLRLLAVFLQPNEIPGRPAERFTVHVEAGRELTASTESIAELLAQVKAGIQKRKSWLFLSDSPDKAEVFVEVLSHRVREEHRTALTTRVRFREVDSQDALQAVDFVTERHYIRASVRVYGLGRELVGHDGKEKKASLKRASSQLAEELEEFLKANYRELAEKRRSSAALGLDLPEPAAAAASTPEPPPVAVDPVFQRYLSSVELYRKGDFLAAAEAVSLLTPRELYDFGTLFLAGDRSDAEWKAAALLHSESVVSVPLRAMNRLELARRAAQHLELARRYSQAISDASGRSRFQKRWHLVVGYYYLAGRQSTGALALLSSGLQLFPADPDLRYALASFHASNGALHGDREVLTNAARVYGALGDAGGAPPSEIDLRLAHVLAELGRLEEAEERLRRVGLDGAGDDAPLAARMIEGMIAQKREQWRTARAAFEKAWKLDPTCQACAVAVAFAREHTGDREAASTFVAEWLASGPRDGPDGWLRFLLGPAGQFEELLDEMRAEVLR